MWDSKKFASNTKKSTQLKLLREIKRLFPNQEIVEEYRDPNLCCSYFYSELIFLAYETGGRLQIDIYIPGLRLGFEYNGKHHYQNSEVFGFVDTYAGMITQHEQNDTKTRRSVARHSTS